MKTLLFIALFHLFASCLCVEAFFPLKPGGRLVALRGPVEKA